MKKILPIFFTIFLTLPITVFAKEGVLDRLGCLQTGNCGLTDVEVGFQLLTNWLIGGIGALGLMFFIWGAIQWITSYGSSEKIKHGRDIMMGSVAAIIVAFVSFLLVQFFINNLLLGGGESEQFQISTECVNAEQGTPCNQPQINYVCSGTFDGDMAVYNNLCITRCGLKNLTTEGNWVCLSEGSYRQHPGLETEDNGCPVKFQTCVNTKTLLVGDIGIDQTNGANSCGGIQISGIDPAQCGDAAANLNSFLSCLQQRLGNNLRITSISDDDAVGNLSRCQGRKYSQPPCDHAKNSCHYGGVSQLLKSCAVDLGIGNGISAADLIINSEICGGYPMNEGSHVHVSVNGCQCDGHF